MGSEDDQRERDLNRFIYNVEKTMCENEREIRSKVKELKQKDPKRVIQQIIGKAKRTVKYKGMEIKDRIKYLKMPNLK